jgi:hypothetical protein
LATAASLDPGSYTNLQLCPGRHDWYRLSLEADESLVFSLTHGETVDLDFEMFDESGQLLGRNNQVPSPSTLRHATNTPKTILLRVHNSAPLDDPATYTLDVEKKETDTCGIGDVEFGVSRRTAQPVGLRSGDSITIEKSICQRQQHWYQIQSVDAAEQLAVEPIGDSPGERRAAVSDSLRVRLHTPDNAVLPVSTNTDTDFVRAGASGDYFVSVTNPSSQIGAYNLNISKSDERPCSEPNLGREERPYKLETETSRAFELCPEDDWEIDWFELMIPPNPLGDKVTLRINGNRYVPEGFFADVVRRDSEGETETIRIFRETAPNTFRASFKVPREPSGRVFMRVYAKQKPGRLREPVTYSPRLRLE